MPLEPHEQDFGATGAAALSRPWSVTIVTDDNTSQFRDSGVEVRRYETNQLDSLRRGRVLTYPQWCAARHASALWRGASLDGCVVSRYEEWVSGARGRWVSTDNSPDEAQPWRELVSWLPKHLSPPLEALVTNTLRPHHMPALRQALDMVAAEIGA
jgi:hypothetical protein